VFIAQTPPAEFPLNRRESFGRLTGGVQERVWAEKINLHAPKSETLYPFPLRLSWVPGLVSKAPALCSENTAKPFAKLIRGHASEAEWRIFHRAEAEKIQKSAFSA